MEKRYFCYNNWLMITGFSPFMSEDDCKAVKLLDGKEAEYIEERDCIMFSLPWGYNLLPSFYSIKQGEEPYTPERIKQSLRLQMHYSEVVRNDWVFVPYDFCTIALVQSSTVTGFCLVSISPNETKKDRRFVHFSIQSPVYCLNNETRTMMDNGIREQYFAPLPAGVAMLNKQEAKVFMTSLDRFIRCIEQLSSPLVNMPQISMERITRYLLIHNEATAESDRLRDYYIRSIIKLLEASPLRNNKLFTDTESSFGSELDQLSNSKIETADLDAIENIGSLRGKVKALKAQGLTVKQVAKVLGIDRRKASNYWNN